MDLEKVERGINQQLVTDLPGANTSLCMSNKLVLEVQVNSGHKVVSWEIISKTLIASFPNKPSATTISIQNQLVNTQQVSAPITHK